MSGKPKVLVIDDEEDARHLMTQLISYDFPGADVKDAVDGNAGVETAKSFSPDVVISDINMPEMNGLEMTKLLKKQDPLTQVIFITGRKDLVTARNAVKLGASDFLEKPVEVEELAASIRKALIARKRLLEDEEKKIVIEEENKDLQKQLAHTQKMEAIGTFAGGIAHDFNNILLIIGGYVDILDDELKENQTLSGFLKEIRTASNRARDLVSQISAFSRTSDNTLDTSVVRLSDLIDEIIKFLRASTPSNVEISVDIKEEKGDYVCINPTHIYQVVLNLCSNAIYSMSERGGFLDISLEKREIDNNSAKMLQLEPGSYLSVGVSDTGSGMSQDVIRQLFTPFFTTKPVNEGTGMGLAVAHGVVKKHGGAIEIESEVGMGSTFTVYLPHCDASSSPPEDSGSRKAPMGNGERILVVDDEKEIANIYSLWLSVAGYSVDVCNDGASALNCVIESPNKYSAIISDVMMPKMTGDVLALELQSIGIKIPVILCTGHSKKMIGALPEDVGAMTVLSKPFTRSTLNEVIQKAVSDNSLSKEVS